MLGPGTGLYGAAGTVLLGGSGVLGPGVELLGGSRLVLLWGSRAPATRLGLLGGSRAPGFRVGFPGVSEVLGPRVVVLGGLGVQDTGVAQSWSYRTFRGGGRSGPPCPSPQHPIAVSLSLPTSPTPVLIPALHTHPGTPSPVSPVPLHPSIPSCYSTSPRPNSSSSPPVPPPAAPTPTLSRRRRSSGVRLVRSAPGCSRSSCRGVRRGRCCA